jgi:hypothetical protein
MKPQDIETRHTLLTCPVCKLNIAATVTAKVEIGTPGAYDAERNSLDLPVTTTPIRFNVNHICTGPCSDQSEASR